MKKIIIILLINFILLNVNPATVALINNDMELKFEKDLQTNNYFDYFLDQRMIDIEKAKPTEINVIKSASQSFTPRNSELARIDLFLYRGDESNGSITVSIRKERNSEDIAMVSKHYTDIPKDYQMGWVSFDFTSVDLATGEKYLIICQTNDNNGVFYWLTSKANPYFFGDAYIIIDEFHWEKQLFYDCAFRTYGLKPMDNNAPSTPTFNGAESGSTDKKYEYSFVSEDDDGDYIFYYIDWDEKNDNNLEYYSHSWIGPSSSGEMQKYFYDWSEKGWHRIRI
ncbi:MAG: hypothetical protein KAR64_08250, partial [Thermoplasmatales archaeon]|nr:hypothetical protein [Thermoplasmatales archaeon]